MKTTGNVFIAEGRERERENPLSFFGVTFHTTNCDVSTAWGEGDNDDGNIGENLLPLSKDGKTSVWLPETPIILSVLGDSWVWRLRHPLCFGWKRSNTVYMTLGRQKLHKVWVKQNRQQQERFFQEWRGSQVKQEQNRKSGKKRNSCCCFQRNMEGVSCRERLWREKNTCFVHDSDLFGTVQYSSPVHFTLILCHLLSQEDWRIEGMFHKSFLEPFVYLLAAQGFYSFTFSLCQKFSLRTLMRDSFTHTESDVTLDLLNLFCCSIIWCLMPFLRLLPLSLPSNIPCKGYGRDGREREKVTEGKRASRNWYPIFLVFHSILYCKLCVWKTICSVTRGQTFLVIQNFVSRRANSSQLSFHSFHLFFSFVFTHLFVLKITLNSFHVSTQDLLFLFRGNPYPILRLQKWNGNDDSGMLDDDKVG